MAMVAAKEHGEIVDVFHAVDIADRAVVDEAVAGVAEDRIGEIVADRRAVLVGVELVADIDIAGLQHVDRP
jgi:hypothetical protein